MLGRLKSALLALSVAVYAGAAFAAPDPHGEDAHHGDAAHHAGEHGGGGLPQLDPTYYASQVFWLAITFLTLYLIFSRAVLPKVGAVIEERRDRIADDLDKAAELKRQSDAAKEAYEKTLADARSKASAIAAETRQALDAKIAEMQAETDTKIEAKTREAEERINAAKTEALTHVREAATETALVIVEKLIGERPVAQDAQDAVDAELRAA